MRRFVTALCIAATIILSARSSSPYTLQFTDGLNPVQIKWPGHLIKITLSNSLDLPQPNIKRGSDVVGAARRAFDHWREAANIRFSISTSDDQSISAAGSRGDGTSLITVAHTSENSAPFPGDGREISGRTRVFATVSGVITEADVVLNPGQSFSSDGTPGTFDLEAVFTHEIGHLLGLEHSGVLGATMQPRQAKNGTYNVPSLSSRSLSDDDRAGVRAIYGLRLGVRRGGAISGIITFASGAPVYGANVWAEDVRSGKVTASNITVANGSYRIDGLPSGEYRVIAQQLDGAILATEIASQRGAYAGLSTNQQVPFATEEIGSVVVKPDATTILSAELSGSPSSIVPSFLGLNKELSSVAVPVIPGYLYKVFVAGEGISAAQFGRTGITSTSPYISISSSSIEDSDFGNGLSVISFDVIIAADAPAGEYSLRFQSLSGEIAYLAGGLTVEGSLTIADIEVDDTVFVAKGSSVEAGSEVTNPEDSNNFFSDSEESGNANPELNAPR